MRLITCNIWNFQRVLHNIAATQEVPRHTRLQLRVSTRVPPTSRGAPFPPPSSRAGILYLPVRERIPRVPVATQEEAISTGKARGIPGSCHHSQSPPDVSVHSRETCFSCTASNFKPRIYSLHGGTWDSLVGSLLGKPDGKASRERHISLDPREGKRDTAATAREESARACPNWRRGLTPLGRLQNYPQDPCQHWRGILRFRHRLHIRSSAPASKGEESREGPAQLTWGLAFPEASRAGP